MKDSLDGVTIKYLGQEIYVNHTLINYPNFCQKYWECIILPGLDKIEAGFEISKHLNCNFLIKLQKNIFNLVVKPNKV